MFRIFFSFFLFIFLIGCSIKPLNNTPDLKHTDIPTQPPIKDVYSLLVIHDIDVSKERFDYCTKTGDSFFFIQEPNIELVSFDIKNRTVSKFDEQSILNRINKNYPNLTLSLLKNDSCDTISLRVSPNSNNHGFNVYTELTARASLPSKKGTEEHDNELSFSGFDIIKSDSYSLEPINHPILSTRTSFQYENLIVSGDPSFVDIFIEKDNGIEVLISHEELFSDINLLFKNLYSDKEPVTYNGISENGEIKIFHDYEDYFVSLRFFNGRIQFYIHK